MVFLFAIIKALFEELGDALAVAEEIQKRPEFRQAIGDSSCDALVEAARIKRNEFLAADPKPCTSFWDEVVIGGLESALDELQTEGIICSIASHQIKVLRQEFDENCADPEPLPPMTSCSSLETQIEFNETQFKNGELNCETAVEIYSVLTMYLSEIESDNKLDCILAHAALDDFDAAIKDDCPSAES